MIIYLYGSDSYRRLQKQKEILAAYREKYLGVSIERFCLGSDKDEVLKFKDFIKNQSLFGLSKLAIVSDLGESNVFEKNLKEKELVELLIEVKSVKEAVVLISEEKKLNKNFDFLQDKEILSQEFNELVDKDYKKWIAREAKNKGLILDLKIIDFLGAAFKGDSWGVVTELENMSLAGQLKTNEVFNSKFQIPNLFTAIYRLKSGNLGARLAILENLLNIEDEGKIFNLTAYSAGAAQKKLFADWDLEVKAGRLDYELALTDLILTS